MKWICSCGQLWTAVGKYFKDHLKECDIAKAHKADKESDVDTSDDESYSKMNAIDVSRYRELSVTPEFGKIIMGSTTGQLTLRYHHEYLFACASCGKRHVGHDAVTKHQNTGQCKEPDSWNNYQSNLKIFYETVTPGSAVIDKNVELRMVKKEIQEKEKERKLEEKNKNREVKKEEKKRNRIRKKGIGMIRNGRPTRPRRRQTTRSRRNGSPTRPSRRRTTRKRRW